MSLQPNEYRQREAAGTLSVFFQEELKDRWDDLSFQVFPVDVIGSVQPPSLDTSETDFPGTLLFSGSSANIICGVAQLPHAWKEGTVVRPHIHWSLPAGGTASSVTWEFFYRVTCRGRASTTWSEAVSGSLAVDGGTSAEYEHLSTFGEIDLTGYPVSTNIAWRLYRRGNSDSNNGTARLLSMDFHILKDCPGGSREELGK